MKVSVSNFKVEKSENLDNAFYVFYFFWHDTLKNVKSRVFLDFEKRKKLFSNYGAQKQYGKTTMMGLAV